MRILGAAALYFASVFASGFVLGIVRVLWAAPRLGDRAAELSEMPLMLAAILLAARWTLRRLPSPPASGSRLAIGFLALALLLAAEVGMVIGVRQVSLPEYLAGRDPVSGVVYLAMLCVFALMPLVVVRGRWPSRPRDSFRRVSNVRGRGRDCREPRDPA